MPITGLSLQPISCFRPQSQIQHIQIRSHCLLTYSAHPNLLLYFGEEHCQLPHCSVGTCAIPLLPTVFSVSSLPSSYVHFLFTFFFWTGKVGFIGGHESGGNSVRALMSAGRCLSRGATIRNVFDPTVIQDEPLFCQHVFKSVRIKLSKSPLLGDAGLLAAQELEFGPV